MTRLGRVQRYASVITCVWLGCANALAQATVPEAPPASTDAQAEHDAFSLLTAAEESMTQVDYTRTRDQARAAIERGALDEVSLARAYRLVGIACAQLGEDDAARAAFIRLFALEPDTNVERRLAPVRRSSVLDAHGFWAARPKGFGLDVSYARRVRQLEVHVRDPLGWAKAIHVFWRHGNRPYTRASAAASGERLFEVTDIGPADTLEVYAYVVDAHDNVLQQLGRDRAPHLFGLSDEELAELLRRDIRGGEIGSYALRLEELGVQVGVHGYASLELKPLGNVPTFDLHHATLMVRASLQHAVSLEMAFEWEHLGREEDDFYLPHAFVDVKFAEALIVRGGFFEVPVGAVNEYLYPDFLRITALPPLFSHSIVPALWSEVGLQLRGRFTLSNLSRLTYAAFVVNGLEQRDDKTGDHVVAEGGDLADMRFNARDTFDGDKAFGGRLGVELGDLDLGVSGYTGRYTIDAARRLTIGDVDLSYRNALLTVRTEAAVVWQDTTRSQLHKYGMYALVALRPEAHLEPYTQYDWVRIDTWMQRVLVGLAIYPFPNERSTRNLRLKSEAGYELPQHGKRNFVWFFQLTTGF